MENLLSVIVPIYNGEKTISRCLNSILEQTYSNIEVIVVDDGSTDDSKLIVEKISKKDQRVRLIKQKSRGSFAARNRGIREAVGLWVGFVDSDDWIEKDTYQRVLTYNDGRADWISFGYIQENRPRYRYGVESGIYPMNKLACTLIYDREKNRPGLPQSIWSKVIKKDILDDVLNNIDTNQRISLGDDAILSYLSALKSERICVYDGCLYHYSDIPGSLCKKQNPLIFIEIQNFYNTMKDSMSRYPVEWGLFDQLNMYSVHIIQMGLNRSIGFSFQNVYFYEDEDQLIGKKIALYGAGRVGKNYIMQFWKTGKTDIVKWIDKNKNDCYIYGMKVETPSILLNIEFDYVVIAVLKEELAVEISRELVEIGVSKDKIIWRKPSYAPPIDMFGF